MEKKKRREREEEEVGKGILVSPPTRTGSDPHRWENWWSEKGKTNAEDDDDDTTNYNNSYGGYGSSVQQ